MTIEIKQLVIRAVAEPRAPGPASGPGVGALSSSIERGAGLSPRERDAIVARCVSEVLRAFERERER